MERKKKENKMIQIGACQGRHPLPVDYFVFGNELPPELIIDPVALEGKATEVINSLNLESGSTVEFYPTGLTVAVLAAMSALHRSGVQVIVRHFDRDSGEYYSQKLSWSAAGTSELS